MNLVTLFAAVVGVAATAAPAAPPAPAPAEVMVLGTYHFDNPGKDLNNVKADDVLTPRRQRELEALAAALAAFRPTKIMIERPPRGADALDPGYRAFTPADLARNRDERVQIAYRLAARQGLKAVYAIDEPGGPGKPDYFPFDKVDAYARSHGQAGAIEDAMGKAAAATKAAEARQQRESVASLLIGYNSPESTLAGIAPYYAMLAVGGDDDQPGAELNAYWYMRNAKIFAKLIKAAAPGDRILVVYGAGHGYWLRHFAAETPGYRLVDVLPYLQRAAR